MSKSSQRRLAALAHVLAALMLLALGLFSLGHSALTPATAPPAPGADPALYRAIVVRMRQGADYYTAAGIELRAPRGPQGAHYPTRSVFNWRLPTLAWVLARWPEGVTPACIFGLVAVMATVCFFVALRREGSGAIAVSGSAVLFSGLLWGWTGLAPEALYVHETWTGLLIALAIAARARGWTWIGVLAGVAALLVRELALPFVVLSAYLAGREGKRYELAGWLIGLMAFGVFLFWHSQAVASHIEPGDLAQSEGWLRLGGWTFVLKTAHLQPLLLGFLDTAPGIVAVLLPLAIYGFGGWRTSLGGHVGLTVLTYVLAFSIAGQAFNYLWGLVYAPLWPLGLVFACRTVRQDWASLGQRSAGEATSVRAA